MAGAWQRTTQERCVWVLAAAGPRQRQQQWTAFPPTAFQSFHAERFCGRLRMLDPYFKVKAVMDRCASSGRVPPGRK
jgi:hypothetical protein